MSNGQETQRPMVPNPENAVLWFDLMRTADKLLEAGLRQQIGPDGDLREAVRQWYDNWAKEHDLAVRQLVRNLHRPIQEQNDAN